MPYEVYSKREHPIPYTFVVKKNNQCLYYFGSTHTYDPKHPQFEILERFFAEFLQSTNGQNRIMLVEGGTRSVKENKEEAILEGSEMHYAVYLADKEGVPSSSPEISDKLKFEKLLEKYTKEEIAYFDFAQICYQWNNMTEKPDFEEYINQFLKRNQEDVGWNDFDFSIENMKLIQNKIFGREFNKSDKQFFYDIVNPTIEKTIINKISREDSDIRDHYILDQIEKYWNEGKSMFIIYGCSHAVMQEPVLRTLRE